MAYDYIVESISGGKINQSRLDLCRWIVEKVADGTITVGDTHER